MIYPIRYYGDPVLRQPARAVTRFDDDLARLAADMIETMYAANGVGLAAPQIGIPWRMFVALEEERPEPASASGGADAADDVSDPASAEPDGEPVDPTQLTMDEKRKLWGVIEEHVMVNPEIVSSSGVQHVQEGCLSVPALYVENLERARRVVVRYQDATGAQHEREAEGHFAQVIQHETDHLDGILFFDRLPDAEQRAFMDAHRSELAEMQREAKALLRQLKRSGSPSRAP